MGKLKDLLLDIEMKLIDGDAYEDVITYVQTKLRCDRGTAQEWVDDVEGQLCMEEERAYWLDQEPAWPIDDSEEPELY